MASIPLVAILAGGLGTRLRPVVSTQPKVLAPVGEEPFLFLLLRTLAQQGVQRVLLLTGYLHEQVFAACGNEKFNMQIHYSRELTPLGTAGALKHAAAYLQAESTFVLLNGDTYLQADLATFLQQPLVKDTAGTIGVLASTDYARFGAVQIGADNVIEKFLEKNTFPTGWINAGIYQLSSRILESIPAARVSSLEKDIFPLLCQTGASGLRAHQLSGTLHDIGTPESYLAFQQERTT